MAGLAALGVLIGGLVIGAWLYHVDHWVLGIMAAEEAEALSASQQ